jgi:hypothetical protein
MSKDDSSYICSSSSSDEELMCNDDSTLSRIESFSFDELSRLYSDLATMKEEAEVIQRANQRLQRKYARLTKALHNVNQSIRRGKLHHLDPSTITLQQHIKLCIDKSISSHPQG